jgi:transglutaminase-like putative cysteine protease
VQQVMSHPGKDSHEHELKRVLPLYAASLVVTLAGVGAVGVTFGGPGWTPIWVFLAVVGHAVSLWLRRLRIPSENVFYPVMIGGLLGTLYLANIGSPLVGFDVPLPDMSPDIATASLVACIAVIRTFTMVTNAGVLFSSVPAITMLALVGSTNPNAEVPLFFGLLILGSLFLCGYEAHLRRVDERRRGTPLVFHLLSAWTVTLGVVLGALLFPLLIQPLIGPLSPFAFPTVSKLRNLINFTQVSSRQAPVGQGPIILSDAPVYEVYTPEGGLLRTSVFSVYTGRSWTVDPTIPAVEIPHAREVTVDTSGLNTSVSEYRMYEFEFRGDEDLPASVPRRRVTQRVMTRGYNPQGIPALGRIVGLRYPASPVDLFPNGSVEGRAHTAQDRVFEVVSEIPDYPEEQLRDTLPVDRASFPEQETLNLLNSTYRVQELTKKITAGVESPYDRVKAILAYIEKNCSYSLQGEVTPRGEDAAAYYLFVTKRGACDLAATAAAVMCRAAGIPARVAVGYVMEEALPGGKGFMVRQEHAHMWLETYFPGYGWVAFNPAPPLARIVENPFVLAWYRFKGLLSKIGGGGLDAILLMIVILVTLALGLYSAWSWLLVRVRERARAQRALSGSPSVAVTQVYARALRLLARRGWTREPWMTPHEFFDTLRQPWSETPEALEALRRLTECFQRARYAGDDSAENLQAAQALCAELARQIPAKPKEARLPAGARSGTAAEGA